MSTNLKIAGGCLGGVALWFVTLGLATAIGSIWGAWLIGYLAAVLTMTLDRRFFERRSDQ